MCKIISKEWCRVASGFSLTATLLFTTPIETFAIESQHVDRAEELIDMGRYRDGVYELSRAKRGTDLNLERDAQQIDYMESIAKIKIGGKGADRPLICHLESFPESSKVNDALFQLAIFNSLEGDMEESVEQLDKVDYIRLNKSERDAYNIRMGYHKFTLGEYPEATHYLAQIATDSPNYSHALYMKSYIAYITENYDTALAGFEQLKDVEMYATVIPYYQMQIAFLQGRYNESIEYGVKLLGSSEKSVREELARTIAESYFRLGDSEQTIAFLDQSIGDGEELTRYEYYIKGFSLHQLERYTEAAEMLKRASGADDEMTQNASFHLANCYLHMKDYRGALKAFAMASNDKFNEEIAEEALFNYAKLQYELNEGLFNETINVLSRYLERYDNEERRKVIQTLLVAAYYNSKNYAAAYENIAKIENPDAEVRAAKQRITYLRGAECFINKEFDEAEKYMNESIEIGVTPKYVALATFWLGEIAYLRGDHNDAQQSYNDYLARAPKSDPMVNTAEYNLAYTMLKQGNAKSALNYFKKYASSTSNAEALRFDAYNRMGDIYYQDRLFDSAASSYNNANKINSKISNYPLYQIATIRGIKGDQRGKITQLNAIIARGDGDLLDDSNYQLGRSYILAGEYQKAIDQLERYIEEYSRSEHYADALSNIGVAYINLNKNDKALEYYDRAIEAAPQSEIAKSAMQGVREIYINKGDANGYFKYAESIGMEGDLNAVSRDSLSFASARAQYLSMDSKGGNKVATALNSYIKEYPKGYYLNDALFYLSDTYVKLGDTDKAIKTLSTLGSRGNSQYSEKVYGLLSDMTYDKGMYSECVDASMKLYEVAKDYKKRMIAMERYVQAATLSGDQELEDRVIEKILKMGEIQTGIEAQRLAKYAKATNLRERGEREAAVEIYRDLAKDSGSQNNSEACFYVIDDTFRRGDRSDAEEQIFSLSESNNADPYWLAKAFLLLGDIYVLEEDSFQARATYQSIVDGYSISDDGIIDEAKSKIEALK